MSKGKVKITQEQADIIEVLKDDLDLKHLIKKDRCMDWAYPYFNGLSDKELAIALYVSGGYEIEPDFKAGDWLNDGCGYIRNVIEVTSKGLKLDNGCSVHFLGNKTEEYNSLEHATDGEAATEKERRFFARNGREPWELKRYDVIVGGHRNQALIIDSIGQDGIFRVFGGYGCISLESIKKHYKVACFAKDRKDIKK